MLSVLCDVLNRYFFLFCSIGGSGGLSALEGNSFSDFKSLENFRSTRNSGQNSKCLLIFLKLAEQFLRIDRIFFKIIDTM